MNQKMSFFGFIAFADTHPVGDGLRRYARNDGAV
jgi:hypothetical protein